MTESSKEYEDLKKFYKAFTGRKMPKEITKFSEIPLMDFHNQIYVGIKIAHGTNLIKEDLQIDFSQNTRNM